MTMVEAALLGMGAIALFAFGAMCLALWTARRHPGHPQHKDALTRSQ